MECECLVCLAKNSGREFSEFANTWVRDNIHHAKPKVELAKIKNPPTRWDKYRVDKQHGFEAGNHQDYALRNHEWSPSTTDIVAEREARAEAEAERPRAASVDLVRRHSSPQVTGGCLTESTGRKVTTFREHETSVIWQPNTTTRPPVFRGAFSSWQMSPKTRRRVVNAGKWLTMKHPHGAFITLTFDRPVCDSDAKRYLDAWQKRLARSEYAAPGVLWVAERTKRHYIHFHLIVSNFVDKDWIQDAWRGVTGLKLYTNVRKVTKWTAPYIVKYAAKSDRAYIWGRRWGQSKYVANGANVNWRSEVEQMTWDKFCDSNGSTEFEQDRVTFVKNGYLLEMKVTPAKRKYYPKEKKKPK